MDTMGIWYFPHVIAVGDYRNGGRIGDNNKKCAEKRSVSWPQLIPHIDLVYVAGGHVASVGGEWCWVRRFG